MEKPLICNEVPREKLIFFFWAVFGLFFFGGLFVGTIQRQKLKRKVEAEELESYPFKPSINRKSEEMLDMSHYKPIHLRVNDIQRAKHASRLAERLSRDASNVDLTFQPKINETSKMLVESKRMETTDPSDFDVSNTSQFSMPPLKYTCLLYGFSPWLFTLRPSIFNPSNSQVTSRLMKDAHDSTRRTLKRQQAYAQEKANQLTFQPHMSRGSKDIISSKSDYMGSTFIERQEKQQKQKEKDRSQRIQQHMDSSECTFHPDTGSASEVLRHTRPHRLNESNLERIERLYRQDVTNKEQKRMALRKRHDSVCTFKPEINLISKSLAKSKTIQELTENRRNQQVKNEGAARREQELNEQCTFQPRVNTSKKAKDIVKNLPKTQFRVNVKEPEKIVKAIDTYRKDREMKLRQTRQEVEYESMKECTFAPDTHGHKVPKQSGPVVVRGLGRYLELKDLAKRLDDEKRSRQEKAFLVRAAKKSNKTKKGATIPQPFNLTKRRGKENARREALAARIRVQQMSECTFHPQTTEAR